MDYDSDFWESIFYFAWILFFAIVAYVKNNKKKKENGFEGISQQDFNHLPDDYKNSEEYKSYLEYLEFKKFKEQQRKDK